MTERRLAIGGVVLGPRPRLVAAGGDAELEALGAAAGADLIELRADLFDDPRPRVVLSALERLAPAGRPVILTVRAANEGGRALPEDQRRALYEAGLERADAIDLEIASGALVAAVVPQARAAGKTVILSFHALDATPPSAALRERLAEGERLGADLVKIVTHAHDLEALRRLLELTLATRNQGIVTLAMGPAGPLSRLLLPAAGSLLTYASVGRPTAPGQMPLGELKALLDRLFPA